MEIVNGHTPESDRNHPIWTSHCIVLRDVHIHIKPEMTSYTTQNKLQFSLVTKTKEVANPEELTRMLELDLNENYKNSKPLFDDNKPYLV